MQLFILVYLLVKCRIIEYFWTRGMGKIYHIQREGSGAGGFSFSEKTD